METRLESEGCREASIFGHALSCRSCHRTVVIGLENDRGKFFHESPPCEWFMQLVSGAEDLGDHQVEITDLDSESAC